MTIDQQATIVLAIAFTPMVLLATVLLKGGRW